MNTNRLSDEIDDDDDDHSYDDSCKCAEPVRRSRRTRVLNLSALRRTRHKLQFDDRDVPGLWRVEVNAALGESQAARCALDGFFETINPLQPDCFIFTVIDPDTGFELLPDGEPSCKSLARSFIGVERIGR